MIDFHIFMSMEYPVAEYPTLRSVAAICTLATFGGALTASGSGLSPLAGAVYGFSRPLFTSIASYVGQRVGGAIGFYAEQLLINPSSEEHKSDLEGYRESLAEIGTLMRFLSSFGLACWGAHRVSSVPLLAVPSLELGMIAVPIIFASALLELASLINLFIPLVPSNKGQSRQGFGLHYTERNS